MLPVLQVLEIILIHVATVLDIAVSVSVIEQVVIVDWLLAVLFAPHSQKRVDQGRRGGSALSAIWRLNQSLQQRVVTDVDAAFDQLPADVLGPAVLLGGTFNRQLGETLQQLQLDGRR